MIRFPYFWAGTALALLLSCTGLKGDVGAQDSAGPQAPQGLRVQGVASSGSGECAATVTNLTGSAIQAAIESLPGSGGTVCLGPGVFVLTSTTTIGNGNGTGPGTQHGIWLRGQGPGATVLQWQGARGGTVLKVNGLARGIKISDLAMDGYDRAATLLDVNYGVDFVAERITGYRWQGGFAVKDHTTGGFGPGSVFQTWDHVIMRDPAAANASGLDIAPEGSGNVSEATFISCLFQFGTDSSAVGLRLGYADHISFYRTLIYPTRGTSGQAVQVKPISGYGGFPGNIAFIGSPVGGGVSYDSRVRWTAASYPALIFYPYYTADGQPPPPFSTSTTNLAPAPANRLPAAEACTLAFAPVTCPHKW